MFSTWKAEGWFVFAHNNEFYQPLGWLLWLKRQKPNNFTIFFWEHSLIKVMIRAGNVTKHWFFFFPSSILSQVFSEPLSVSHHTCTSHINSFPQINSLWTDVPTSFKVAAKPSGVSAAQPHVPAYLGRANLLLGVQFPFRVPCWWARALSVFKVSNLLWCFWLKLAI